MFYRDIVWPSYSLKFSSFINYIKDRASINIHNVNKYGVVKVKIFKFTL